MTNPFEQLSQGAEAPTSKSAAKAIADSLSLSLTKKGILRRRPLSFGKQIARDHFGWKRMGEKRWQEILQIGLDAGWFTIEGGKLLGSLSPDEDAEETIAEAGGGSEETTEETEEDDWEPPPPPKNGRCGPKMFDCGHWNWGGDHASAHKEGKCCANWSQQPSWQDLKGEYLRPLPMNVRRTQHKTDHPGFPGYCCDSKGYYVGGIGNNCRFNKSKRKRCPVHGGKPYEPEIKKSKKKAAPKAVAAGSIKSNTENVDSYTDLGKSITKDKKADLLNVEEAIEQSLSTEVEL